MTQLESNPSLVSVVIPLYNKENYIFQTLKSVYDQTYKSIELIIIDDGSTDESAAVVERFCDTYSARFSNVIFYKQNNSGQSIARNLGIAKSKGEFIAFLDSDDVWHPQKLAKQVAYLKLNPDVDLVLCNYVIVNPHRRSTRLVSMADPVKKIRNWLVTSGYGGALESTGLVRKSTLTRIGAFDSDVGMCGGLDLAVRVSQNGFVHNLNTYLCGYRVLESGWHSNKQDLLRSLETLLSRDDFYADLRFRLKQSFLIHILIWELRNGFRFSRFITFFVFATRHPFFTTKYLVSTTWRIVLAKTRVFFSPEPSRYFLESIRK